MLLRNRVPRDYFVTSGVGQSELTIHAGSFHFALYEAGIHSANILTYSSILPATAREISREEYEPVHGEVMETIMAVQSCRYGDTATAGMAWGWMFDRDGKRQGGLVTEYAGSMPASDAEQHVHEMLAALHKGTYGDWNLEDVRTSVRSITPTQMFGTALVGMCFVNAEYPEGS